MKSIVAFLILFLNVFTLAAQSEPEEICGYNTELQRILKRRPNYLIWQEALYKQAMLDYQLLQNNKRTILSDTIYYEIPVVFHVLYNNAAENVNDLYINSQLNELNLAFRKLTSDTSRIRSIFKPVAADVKIQFVLADKDPQGNPSTGIIRKSTTKSTFATIQFGYYNYTTDMKYSSKGGDDAWDPTSYMNIWICDMEYPGSQSIVYGFATPPTGAPNWNNTGNVTKDSTDLESGVVLHYKIVGKNNPLAPTKYTEGKSAIHEVGHYLGLRHVWGDGNWTTGCSVDDGIFDTPNSRISSSACQGQNTCTDASNDLPDQTENYMDYSLDGCAAMFTKAQAHMMRFVLNTCRTGLPIRYIEYDTIPDPKPISDEIKVYPNPAISSDDVHILIPSKSQTVFNVHLIDMSGKYVLSTQVKSNTEQTLETSAVSGAVYTLLILDSSGTVIERRLLLLL